MKSEVLVLKYGIQLSHYVGPFCGLLLFFSEEEGSYEIGQMLVLTAPFVEKFYGELFSYLKKLTANRSLSEPELNNYEIAIHKVLRRHIGKHGLQEANQFFDELSDELKQSYSPISRRLSLSNIKRIFTLTTTPMKQFLPMGYLEKAFTFSFTRIKNSTPFSFLKKKTKSFLSEFNMTIADHLLRAINKGNLAKNSYVRLDSSFNESKIIELINSLEISLTLGTAPYGLKLIDTSDKISPIHHAKIDKLLQQIELNHAGVACTTLQQGKRDRNSPVFKLPQDILNRIYNFSYPDAEKKDKIKHFTKNVSSFFPSKRGEVANSDYSDKENEKSLGL